MRQLKITNRFTNRDTVNQYINDVAQYVPVSPEEEVTLAQRIKKGDNKAKEQLINANLRFVVSVAKQYQFQGLPLEDLINEGNIGLIKAAERYDETRGFKFISYAIWWIRQSIMCALSTYGRAVRLPQNQSQLACKIYNAIAKYEQEHEESPTIEQLASILNTKSHIIRDILWAENRASSLDAPLSKDGDNTLGSLLYTTDKENMSESLVYDLNRVLDSIKCKPKEKEILLDHFGIGTEPMTYAEIAIKYNLTRERVRQIIVKLLNKLKQNSNILVKYL
jgi:RNA polymerase primary sigma factor